jgi:DNA polymerase III alpha subunit (gram-positive type)
MPYGDYGSFARRVTVPEADLLVVDLETSGVKHTEHEIIELACIRTDPTGATVLDEFCCKVLPTRPVPEEAAQVNGYNEALWLAEAWSLDAALRELMQRADQTLFVAWNKRFDRDFLEAAMRPRNLRWSGPYPAGFGGDPMELAWPLLKAGLIPNRKLGTVAAYFGLDQGVEAHRALSDARTCLAVYRKLMTMWRQESAA